MDPITALEAKKESLHAELVKASEAAVLDEATIAKLSAEFEATDADIAKRRAAQSRVSELRARISEPARKTTDWTEPPRGGATTGTVTGGEYAGAKPQSFGFRSIGEFARVVAKGSRPGGHNVDERLTKIYDASLSTYGSEGIGADGGYLVPPDLRTDVIKKVMSEDSLLGYTQQLNTASNSVSVLVDEVTPWDGTNGVQAYWLSEAATVTQSKPKLNVTTIRAEKLIAVVPVTDELLADAPALTTWLSDKAGDKITYKVNEAIINGTGVGTPAGIIGAGGTVSQAAESGQTAATVVYNNITKMWSRMRDSQRRGAIWIANQDLEPQLQALVVPGSSPAFPAYLPPGGLSDQKYAMLMGRPIVYSEATSALGTVGDLILADMSTYLTVVKGGGVRQDISIHLWFDQDTTAFRWVLRMGGQPLWKTTVTRPGSKPIYGSFVTLAAR